MADRFGWLRGIEQEALRWRYQFRGELPSAAPIRFVDIDNAAISYMGDRPWDRALFSRLLEALLGPGEARVVGIDIILSKFSGSSLMDLEAARAGKVALGKTLKRYPGQVVLGAGYTGIRASMTDEILELPLRRTGFTDPEMAPFPEAPSFPVIDENFSRFGLVDVDEGLSEGTTPSWVPAYVETAGARFGLHLMDGARIHFGAIFDTEHRIETDVAEGRYLLRDADGWSPFSAPLYSEQRLLNLGIEMFLARHGLSADHDVKAEVDALTILKKQEPFRRIPLTKQQSLEVNWFQGWDPKGAGNHESMREVLEKADALAQAFAEGNGGDVRALEQWFSGRFNDSIVFVGPVDPMLKDLAPTPFNRIPVPKVGLHANIYRTVEAEAFLHRPGPGMALALLVLLPVIVGFLSIWSGPCKHLVRSVGLGILIAYTLFAFYAFARWHWVLPVVPPVGAALSATFCIAFVKLGAEEWERRRIKNLFGAYVSPDLVEEMVRSQRDPELGGVEAEVTALFSDVEGFSALSEELSAKRLIGLMNEYLSAMTLALHEEKGTLDKYIGDAIVTMFGMPYPVDDHAARACLAALRMQERHAELREAWKASGDWPLAVTEMRTRIGINAGMAVIGNMGSSIRFNYTMMGDTVNLAARCESGAKQYGVYVMVTGAVLKAALPHMPELRHRQLDRIIVKGKSEAVDIFELWDGTVDPTGSEACRNAYEAGLAHYFAGRWEQALAQFEASAPLEPHADYAKTTPSAVMLERCRGFLETGTPRDWKGVYAMQDK